MSLHDTPSLFIVAGTATESLPDPTTVSGRVNFLVSTVNAVWSCPSPALPFFENGLSVATISIPAGQFKEVSSNGSQWLVQDLAAAGGLTFPTVATPARTFNTDFVPNVARPTLCYYSVSIDCSTTLASGADGRVTLLSDSGVAATVRAACRNKTVQTVGVSTGIEDLNEYELAFLVPAGWHVNIATVINTGTPIFTLTQQTEITI